MKSRRRHHMKPYKTHGHRKTMRSHLHMGNKTCCETTFHGLHEWMEHMFEQLGWMVLAKDRGYTDKTQSYVKSVYRLKKAIEHKMTHIHDEDKREDLEIMLYNVNILCHHVNRDFH